MDPRRKRSRSKQQVGQVRIRSSAFTGPVGKCPAWCKCDQLSSASASCRSRVSASIRDDDADYDGDDDAVAVVAMTFYNEATLSFAQMLDDSFLSMHTSKGMELLVEKCWYCGGFCGKLSASQ